MCTKRSKNSDICIQLRCTVCGNGEFTTMSSILPCKNDPQEGFFEKTIEIKICDQCKQILVFEQSL